MPVIVLVQSAKKDTGTGTLEDSNCRFEHVSAGLGWVQDGTPLIPFSKHLERPGRPTATTTITTPGPIYEGLTFHVKAFPIVVSRLGIWRPLLDSLGTNESVTVGLRNRRTNELLFHAAFSGDDRTLLPVAADGPEAGYAFQALNKKSHRADLPAGFEGSLQLRMRSAATGSRSAQTRPAAFQATECTVKFHNQLGNPGIFVITGTGIFCCYRYHCRIGLVSAKNALPSWYR